MAPEEFDSILQLRLERICETLKSKGEQYATEADRLHNFKRSAAFTGKTPAEVCVGFMVKHLTSVMDMVDEQSGPTPRRITRDRIDEKIGDAINYLIILEAILLERDPVPSGAESPHRETKQA